MIAGKGTTSVTNLLLSLPENRSNIKALFNILDKTKTSDLSEVF
jgi:hypothetical protein